MLQRFASPPNRPEFSNCRSGSRALKKYLHLQPPLPHLITSLRGRTIILPGPWVRPFDGVTIFRVP
jgi:hypothetical protein